MAAFHVFVEGAIDSSPAGIDRLAAAIAEHYGLPAGELRTRLAKGRFRVKGNCDRATADSYVRDLSQLGARCTVEDAAAPPSRASTPAIATPAHGTRTTTPPPSALKSGLAAAFGGDSAQASLGALDSNATFTLASVDGGDDAPAPPAPAASFAPPPPAAIAASPVKKTTPKPVAAAPVDMFAPPDAAEEAAFKVELADDEVERAAKKRVSIPPATEPASAPEPPPSRVSRVSIQPATVAPAPRGMADPKTRFALGVLIAIVVGFVPAHLLASVREKSAYSEIDRAVDQTQREADTPDAYDALDAFRQRQLVRKYDARRSAAILAFLVWGVLGGGVAYVWFRRIRWPES
ncbi:MAG TPA: hypothetical protein VGG28_25740 [Kofleriaceae bacterium]|jgi:hypothetical protein